jgi:lipopolysaccharide transport system permease protein
MKNNNSQSWIIQSKTSAVDFKLKQILNYRYLIYCMIYRDITALYKQTILGPVWILIQPLLTTGVFTLIFGRLSKMPTDGVSGPLFYLSGVVAWNYFAECLNRTSTVFKDNYMLFEKVYFPRLIIPISIALSLLFRFLIQLLLLCAAIFIFHHQGTHFEGRWTIALLPLITLLMVFQGLGIGILIAALTAKYRDLTFLLAFSIQLLMYATPVIYPLSAAPANLKWIILANPMTAVVETFRFSFFGSGDFSWINLLGSAVTTLILLFTGLLAFSKTEKNFIDTL